MAIVSIEGLDGVGKSSLARALAGDKYQLLSEPGGTAVGELIRDWVKGQEIPAERPEQQLAPAADAVIARIDNNLFPAFHQLVENLFYRPARPVPSAEQLALTPLEEAALFNIARAQLLASIPEDQDVIFDRFIDSTVAYQGYGRQWPIVPIIELNEAATAGRQPEITFYLRLDEDLRRQRLAQRQEVADRIEALDREFFLRAAEGFDQQAAAERQRIITLDARQSPEQLVAQARPYLP
jgi:thymidylate kinase